MQLWAVGLVKGGENPNLLWDLQGVFSTKLLAEKACHGPNFCVIPLELDVEAPIETVVVPDAYYPFGNCQT